MSTLMHRLASSSAVARLIALGLAAAVTLGAMGGVARLADQQYNDALLAQDLSSPADQVFFSSPLIR